MRYIRGGRWLAWCAVGCVMGVFAWVALSVLVGGSGSGFVADASVADAGAVSAISLDSLVVPGVQALDEGQQAVDAQQARRSSSAAYVARVRSRTAFAHLGAARAAQVARKAFPEVIEHPAGGALVLPAGERIARYVGSNAAQVDLPGGKHGIVESLTPMARRTSPGHFVPIDLRLKETGGGYAPAGSDVATQIPKRLGDGVGTPQNGVSLTPVDGRGNPLGGRRDPSTAPPSCTRIRRRTPTQSSSRPSQGSR